MAQGPDMIRLLTTGLQGANLRNKVIANNLANLDSPGFRRSEVAFEKVLADAIEDNKPADMGENDALVFTPGGNPLNDTGNDVSLDVEVGDMVKNGAMYKTYIRLLGRMYRQMDMAMRDNGA